MSLPILAALSAATVLALCLKATLILTGVWVLVRMASRASAAIRHEVWMLGLLTILCLPAAQVLLPPIGVDLPIPSRLTPIEQVARGVTSVEDGAIGDGASRSWFDGGWTGAETNADVARRAEGARSWGWGEVLLGVWFAGAALRLMSLALTAIRTRRLRYSARPTSRRSTRFAAEIAELLGVGRRVEVCESSLVPMPLTWGVMRPVVVLPRGVDDWPDERLRAVLLHEVAHVRRCDYLTWMMAEIAFAVYWPVPLVWLARHRVWVEQEVACDDQVLAAGTPPLDYAEHLLAAARALSGSSPAVFGGAVAMVRDGRLTDRIRAILDGRVDRRPLRGRARMQTALAIAAIGLPVAALQADSGARSAAMETAAMETAAPAGIVAAPIEPIPGPPAGEEPPAPVLSYLWLEAENAGSAIVREDLDASAAGYAVLPAARGRGRPSATRTLDFSLAVPSAGEYVIWGRVIPSRRESDALHLSIDGRVGPAWDLDDGRERSTRAWSWSVLSAADPASADRRPVRIRLDAGEHRLQIRGAGDEVRIDRVLVTTDTLYRPSGRGQTDGAIRKAYHLIEAEHADLAGRLRDKTDDDASGGEYLVFRSGRAADGDGAATFVVDIEERGRYLVWGRISAPDDDSNSFFVSVDGGEEVIWDAPRRSVHRSERNWTWDPLNARELDGRTIDPLVLEFEAGRHEVRLRTREAGVRLDALLVTNDLDQRPRGIDRLPSVAESADSRAAAD